MLSGPFGTGLGLPFDSLPLLLTLLAAGLWAGQLGGAELWRVPAAIMAGLIFGVVWPRLGLALPHAGWAVAGAVILLGVLAAGPVKAPGWLAGCLAAASAVPAGFALVASARPLAGWFGFGLGALIGLAAGVGLVGMAGQALPGRGPRVASVAAVLGGAWLLFGSF